jgi:hypothetical protein
VHQQRDGCVAGSLVEVVHPQTVDVQVMRREGEVVERPEVRVGGAEEWNPRGCGWHGHIIAHAPEVAVIQPREIHMEEDAFSAIAQILGIMTDNLDLSLPTAQGEPIVLGIDDVSLILAGMAFTEVMSMEFPFFDMVQWTSDFVSAELRKHWTDEEWLQFAG